MFFYVTSFFLFLWKELLCSFLSRTILVMKLCNPSVFSRLLRKESAVLRQIKKEDWVAVLSLIVLWNRRTVEERSASCSLNEYSQIVVPIMSFFSTAFCCSLSLQIPSSFFHRSADKPFIWSMSASLLGFSFFRYILAVDRIRQWTQSWAVLTYLTPAKSFPSGLFQ